MEASQIHSRQIPSVDGILDPPAVATGQAT